MLVHGDKLFLRILLTCIVFAFNHKIWASLLGENKGVIRQYHIISLTLLHTVLVSFWFGTWYCVTEKCQLTWCHHFNVIYLLDINWFCLCLYLPLTFFPLQHVYLCLVRAIFIMLDICLFKNNFSEITLDPYRTFYCTL